jgi:hypothetical protein
MEREKLITLLGFSGQENPITLLAFSGQEETSFGKYFIPLINLWIADHVSQISCEIGPLEIGVDLIIPGG